jgi:MFS family permease
MTIIGLVGIAVGSSILSMMPASFGIAGYIAPIVVITAGYALFQAANNTAIMTGIRPDQRGVISGMLSLSRNLGLITGASVMGAVFALASATIDITTARPEAVATGMRITFAAAAILIVGALAIAVGSPALSRRVVPPNREQEDDRGLKAGLLKYDYSRPVAKGLSWQMNRWKQG